MTAVDVDALDAARAAATPGLWKLWGMDVMADQDGTSNVDTAVRVAHTCYRDENGKPRTFDAELICQMQRALPDLLAEVRRGRALREAVEGLHVPHGIYDECGHDHAEGDVGVVDVDDVGLVCDDGLMYRVCQHCCLTGKHFYDYQTEECATSHKHGKDEPICPTIAALAAVDPS